MMISHEDQFMAAFISLVMFVVYEFACWRRERQMIRKEFIGVPPRTSLYSIVRRGPWWIVWTGVDNMQVPYEKWRGTHIRLCDNGTAYRVVVQPDGTEDVMRIK